MPNFVKRGSYKNLPLTVMTEKMCSFIRYLDFKIMLSFTFILNESKNFYVLPCFRENSIKYSLLF